MEQKQTVVVSGGTRGIGAAISELMVGEGYKVFALYLKDKEQAENFAAKTGVTIMQCDVGDYKACAKTVSSIESQGEAISVLVNNAGITRDAMFHKMNQTMWRDVVRTNLDGVFNLTHSVWPRMMAAEYGRVVNISSINGQTGQIGQANYSATKAAILGLTRTLAMEGARYGITVNAVAPGYIETDMVANVPERVLERIKANIPVGRLGQAVEIARCVVFLADTKSEFITGSTLTANGAQHLV